MRRSSRAQFFLHIYLSVVSPVQKSTTMSKRERNFWTLVILSLILAVITWRNGNSRTEDLVVNPTDPATVISAQPTPEFSCADQDPFSAEKIATWTATHNPGTFNATVIDLVNNCTYSIGTPDATFPMASTGKVIIATGVLEKVARGEIDYAAVESDMRAMITVSDNAAADRLFALIGKAPTFQDIEARYGLTKTTTDRGWGTTLTNSADQVALLNQVIGVAPTGLPEAQRSVLRELMKSVVPDQAWGAGSNIPAGWSGAVKNGWYQAVPGDIPPVGLWRVNTVGMAFDETGKPRWAYSAYSNEWPTQAAGVSAWNDLAALIAAELVN